MVALSRARAPSIGSLKLILLVVASATTAVPRLEKGASWGEWHDGTGVSIAEAGFSFYTRIMDVFQEPAGPVADLSFGMGATWLRRGPCADPNCGSQVSDSNTTCACPNNCCKGGHLGNRSCGWLMQSMEGGPGHFPGQLPSKHAKWRIGDSVGVGSKCCKCS
jgi:hypothetical protein